MKVLQINSVCGIRSTGRICTDIADVLHSCGDECKIAYGRESVPEKYGFPKDKKIFVYGGNLGRPQDVPFIIKCISACIDLKDAFFVVAGSGTHRSYLEEFVKKENPENLKLLKLLPKDEYDKMIACCDGGLIFLDHRFTIPNFPSRLLAYMQAKLPVIACTDKNTDIGEVVVCGGFGYWCESLNEHDFKKLIEKALQSDLKYMGEKGYEYLLNNYTVDKSYKTIVSSIKMKNSNL